MTRQEYEYLQERFSKLLAKKPYGRANEKEAYRSGVLAAKSVLKDVYEHSYSTAKDDDAAAAIEALEAEVKRLKEANDELREAQTYIDHYGDKWLTSAKDVPTSAYNHGYMDGKNEAEQALEPKRGKWIVDGMYTYNLRELNGKAYEPVYRCSCCNRQMESYLRLDEPKMPGDADFPEYCPHCGARMTEVQDA